MNAQASPKQGVYAVRVELDGRTYNGAANLGYNPTFSDNELSLEVHILDFHENVYGKPLTVRFVDRLRDEKRFSGPQELADQIRKDVARAREILSAL
jgi:riboflavin kinase/FMN adenylyltransferase